MKRVHIIARRVESNERMLEVLQRDYGELYTGVGAAGVYRGQEYSQEKCYLLYE